MNPKDPTKFAGYGSFSNKILENKNKIVIGETAGFQDFLWGFGIRNAVKSGFIAAKSILDGEDFKDYYKTAEKYFKPRLNAGVVNRFFWEKFASNNYSTHPQQDTRIRRSTEVSTFIPQFQPSTKTHVSHGSFIHEAQVSKPQTIINNKIIH